MAKHGELWKNIANLSWETQNLLLFHVDSMWVFSQCVILNIDIFSGVNAICIAIKNFCPQKWTGLFSQAFNA